ncbi:hypothetical protein TIFTF001_019067 [Ficus carica]|uniref:Uncharacterized protein n=1 Tax=Ficus carica TaxID=3494 RepID=A0AA88AWC2_FICCA|nr:hypothetical protein TIFTF001_019067 [Ficus carica]
MLSFLSFNPRSLSLFPFCQAREREREPKTIRHALFQTKANTNLDRQIRGLRGTQVFNGQYYREVPVRRRTGSNLEEPVALVRSTPENGHELGRSGFFKGRVLVTDRTAGYSPGLIASYG